MINRRSALALAGAALAAPAVVRAETTALPDRTLKILSASRPAAAPT